MNIIPRAFVPVLLAQALVCQAGWSVPAAEPNLNSTAADSGVNLSYDGLTLYFSSFRSGNWEIWSSTRSGPGGAWSSPVQETGLGGPDTEDQPCIDVTGLEMLFSSTRAGGAGSSDLWRSTRATPSSPWNTPVPVSELNSSVADSAPSLTADGLEVFFYSTGWGNPSGNNNSLFTATRASTALPFGTPQLVVEFSNSNTHRDCDIAADGLSIVFTEFVSPRLKVLYSERLSRTSPWAPPVVWTEFDTVGASLGVYSFTRSAAGNEALLAAGFPTSAGGQEILSTAFTGLTHAGAAGFGSVMTIYYRDPLNAGQPFALGAALGNTGFALGARIVPLDPDWLLLGTFGTSVPGYTSGWGGVLGAGGEATASLTNLSPAFVGLSFWVGGLTWDNSQPFGVGTIANAFQVQFQ
ncbi:MAG: PD40 domain-containing protein [Planctomycetes bacterium]|jgi:hypothetical protein|nr:PD40 domain-containing protein [Planctomycetota bacterium]